MAGRLAGLLPPRPPGLGGNPPLPLEVRLDAVATVVLDGLSYRRAGRMVGISKTEVGESVADVVVAAAAQIRDHRSTGAHPVQVHPWVLVLLGLSMLLAAVGGLTSPQ